MVFLRPRLGPIQATIVAVSLLTSHVMSFQRARRIARCGAFAVRPRRSAFSAAAPVRMARSLAKNSRKVPSSTVFSSLVALGALQKEEVDPGQVAGTELRILKYPHPSLRAENAPVSEAELRDGSIAQIAKEMFLVMYAAEGIGLAAPQVGINKKLMVYNESGDKKKWLDEVVMVNPVITEFSEAVDVETEGCLSFPAMNGEVERSKWIKVEALNLRGKKISKKFTGWEARIFQHEYDHLNGVVYIDRLLPDSKKAVENRLKELIEEHDADSFGGPAL